MTDIAKNTQAVFELYKAETPDEAAILMLVKDGVDVKAINPLLHLAASKGHPKVCADLIKQGADIHARNEWGVVPLHSAAASGHLRVCEWLVNNGADIHAPANDGETPLYKADFYKEQKVVEYLLARGANIWAQLNNGKTALDRVIKGPIVPHCYKWAPKLKVVKGGDCREIKTVTDIYHLASVMQPSNPHNVPPPKEFIRTLFLQYIPHEPKFDHLYEAIFAAPRPPEFDLHTARKEAAKREVAR